LYYQLSTPSNFYTYSKELAPPRKYIIAHSNTMKDSILHETMCYGERKKSQYTLGKLLHLRASADKLQTFHLFRNNKEYLQRKSGKRWTALRTDYTEAESWL